jgi:beta-glucosidase
MTRMIRFIAFAASMLVVASGWISNASAAEEICGACNPKVIVSGEFFHRNARGRAVIQGAPETGGEAFVDAIFGTNFTVSVPNLAAGRYSARFGFAETEFKAAGQRRFDITCGDQLIRSNLDLFAAAGDGAVYFVTANVEHAGDAQREPLTFTFSARKELAKLNTFELLDDAGKTIVFLKAMDLINGGDAEALKIPEMTMPMIWNESGPPITERARDLVSRLSLSEKVAQLQNGAPAIPRLGVPAYNYWNECLHGVARNGFATVFPQAIGLAATWDAPLLREVADAIATEARAKNNEFTRTHHGDSARYYGLTFWTPNINIFRDPRWGRGQETYGEDPFLTARMGVAFIRGLQGDDPKYIKAMACAKHFAVHSGPEPLRHTFNAVVSERDLYETYLPHFEAAVREAKVGAVMGAYNRVDGEPACSSEFLLNDLLRKQWGFKGHVVSDCAAIYDIYANHKMVRTPEEAAARAVKAGCDLCCSTDYNSLVRAVRKGLITEAEIDTALSRVFQARIQLGLFDPPEAVPYRQIPVSEIDSPQHEALALRAARESIVLLKNDGLLPLNRAKLKRIAVIGTNANSVEVLLGNYYGTPSRPVTILDGIRRVAGTNIEVVYEPGCPLALRTSGDDRPDPQWLTNAVAAAKSADLVIYAGGISLRLEDEEMKVDYQGFNGGDRTRIELPPVQTELLKALRMTGKPVVFVNCSGGAMAMAWEAQYLPAILQAWYPGEQGGRAVAEVLFGDVNPAGRLPVTFYQSTFDLPPFEDYAMSNRTYRYFGGTPLFAFGHGLSYTRFGYREARLNTTKISANGTLALTVRLANTGRRDGDEVIQAYFRHVKSAELQPRMALCGFARVHVTPGEAAKVSLEIPAERFRYWDTKRKQYVVEPGDYVLMVGAASDDIRVRVPFKLIGP